MHKPSYGFLILLLSTLYSLPLLSQEIRGIVYELESSEKIRNVTVTNIRTQQETQTDGEGNFTIGADLNDYLTLTMPGYQTDTAFVYHDGVYRIYLTREDNTIIINEVLVTRLTDSRLDIEIQKAKNEGQYMEVGAERGGIRISPSRLFGKKAKNARNNLDLLIEEKDNRIIDRRFNNRLIASLTPLTEEEIPLFREQYRPTIDFIRTASDEDLKLYIMDSYKLYQKDN